MKAILISIITLVIGATAASTKPVTLVSYRVVQSIFTKIDDPRLRGFVVWLPMLSDDDQREAELQARTFTDARVTQRWDGRRESGKQFSKTLRLNGAAWDVYLLYAPGVRWSDDTPPQPTFWMHQLRSESGADQRVCLNPAVMMSRVQALLRR